jgi:hypothetical protein
VNVFSIIKIASVFQLCRKTLYQVVLVALFYTLIMQFLKGRFYSFERIAGFLHSSPDNPVGSECGIRLYLTVSHARKWCGISNHDAELLDFDLKYKPFGLSSRTQSMTEEALVVMYRFKPKFRVV